MKRREFNKSLGLGVAGVAVTGVASCSSSGDYGDAVAATWRHTAPRVQGRSKIQTELVRYATLAANSHNTQPWQFRIESNRISIFPDFSRRCPAVDPDDHHLYASLGCAAENLSIAAAAHGLDARASFVHDEIQVDLEARSTAETPLFLAIPERQCTRAAYDGKSLSSDELALLDVREDDDIELRVFTEPSDLEVILEYVVAGNTAQMRDEHFVKELKEWIRFSEAGVLLHRDGLFSASSGNPTVPEWLGRLVLSVLFTEESENDKYRDHIRSSAGIIAFISKANTKEQWFKVGRAYQRFALQSTSMGLKHAFINQAVEVPDVRRQFAAYLGLSDRRPDLLVRFGYGPSLPRSLRRPLESVLI